MAAGRRAAVLLLLCLLAGGLLLSVAPGDPGALRLRGVGVLWWYTFLAAPLAALAVTVPALATRSAPPAASVAFWVSPVVPAVVAARVFDGAADAPVVALAAALAPLLALLVARTPAAPADVGTRLLGALSAALVLGAGLSVLAGVGTLLHLPTAAVVAVATGCAALATLLPRVPAAAVRDLAFGFGGVGFIVLIAAAGLDVGVAPWVAWRDVASRPALVFDPASPAVLDGRTILRATTLTFTEPHRITARAPGVYRVTEGARPHEWRLRAGDSLELRPGDRLLLEAGARLTFEAGKRVPTAPVSGVAWADPAERGAGGATARAAGVVLSVLGGAMALVPPVGAATGARAILGVALAVGLVLAAGSLGIWSVGTAPELALGAPPLVAPLALPPFLLGARWGRAWMVLCALALLLLLTAAAAALSGAVRGGATGGARHGQALGLVVLVVAAATAVWPGDPWRVGVAGLGLAASAVAAPRLGGGGRGAALGGALAGTLAFGGLALAAPWLPAWAGALGAYPALVAAPLAFAASLGGRVAATGRG